MKKSLSLAAALAAVVLTGSAFAYAPSDSVHQAAASAAKLVPTKVVNPTGLPRSFRRDIVQIEFSLDQAGQPRDIKVVSNTDRETKKQIVKAFSQWRFEPGAIEAGSGTKRFVLPLEVVPEV